jgi:hypothetical protein
MQIRPNPDPDPQQWWMAYLFAVVFPLVLEEVGGTVEALQANVALMFPTYKRENKAYRKIGNKPDIES